MRNLLTTAFFAFAFILLFVPRANGQGCVAIRHFSSCSTNNFNSQFLSKGDWLLGMNYRYFRSFRHFRGTVEEPDRVANGTEVVNHSHSWDFNITLGINERWFANLTLPFVINTRSSLYEHGRSERHLTTSRGLADVRAGVGYWLFKPETHPYANLALGLGVKLPTGDFAANDIFYNVGPDGEPQVRPVDQSIQPGDGGFGIALDAQFFQKLSEGFFIYGSGFYLLNPKGVNGTRTFRETLSPILINEAVMAVPDQYGLRAGLSYSLGMSHLGASLGARYEAVPVKDILGSNEGFRRPGSVFSAEPGINYMKGNLSLNLSVPVAIMRKRPQSVTDLETEKATGQPRNGDAAFADYLINVGLTYRINKGPAMNLNVKEFNQN
ncbi:MAG: transporter [Phaeodactylibacter sp.]|nr:transporter [Phaeodactylibacter sp.]